MPATRWLRRVPVGALCVAVLVPLAAFMVSVWISGSRLHVVTTGSMAPTYPEGTLLVARPATGADVRPGDVIAFAASWAGGETVVHRARKVTAGADGVQITTQGDAATTDDPFPVEAGDVRAVVRWDVPRAGSLLWSARGWRAPALLVALPGTLLLVDAVRHRRRPVGYICADCGAAAT